jgi:hypothetical protein
MMWSEALKQREVVPLKEKRHRDNRRTRVRAWQRAAVSWWISCKGIVLLQRSYFNCRIKLHKKVSLREEGIFLRNLSQLKNTAKHFYELNEQQMVQAIEHDVYRGVEGD